MQDPRHQEIVTEVNSWLGVPYQHQGASKFGSDCIGLPTGVSMALGYLPPTFFRDNPDARNYGTSPYGLLVPLFRSFCNEVAIADMAIAHILIFWIDRESKEPQHCGVLTGNDLFVHAHQGAPRIVENTLSAGGGYWRDRITHVFQFPPKS